VKTKDPTHQWVADKLDMSVSGVSLLRNGKRHPSLSTMEVVEREIGWELCDQVLSRHNYADDLNAVLRKAYTTELNKPIPGQMTIEETA
jgi:hypothetical protein